MGGIGEKGSVKVDAARYEHEHNMALHEEKREQVAKRRNNHVNSHV
jgi:hypothetical protein